MAKQDGRTRRSKLTPATQKKIVDCILAGNYACVACEFAGVHVSTFYKWMQQGETAQSGKFRELFDAVRAAEIQAEVRAAALVQKAAAGDDDRPGDWRAAAWYLERKFQDRWRPRNAVEVSGAGGGPVQIEQQRLDRLRELTDAELEVLAGIHEKLTAGG